MRAPRFGFRLHFSEVSLLSLIFTIESNPVILEYRRQVAESVDLDVT